MAPLSTETQTQTVLLGDKQTHVSVSTFFPEIMLASVYRPYSHKLPAINNYVNCPSNFAFARSIYLFHPPIFEKSLCKYGLFEHCPLVIIKIQHTSANVALNSTLLKMGSYSSTTMCQYWDNRLIY